MLFTRTLTLSGLGLLPFVALVALVAIPANTAVVPVEVVADDGNPAPGSGLLFGDFGRPVINDAGQVSFEAELRTAANTVHDASIWHGDGGALTAVALPGEAVPDHPGRIYTDAFFGLQLNDLGELGFGAILDVGTAGLIGLPGALGDVALDDFRLGHDGHVLGLASGALSTGPPSALVPIPEGGDDIFAWAAAGRGSFRGDGDFFVGSFSAPTLLAEDGGSLAVLPGETLEDLGGLSTPSDATVLLAAFGTQTAQTGEDNAVLTWTPADGFEVLLRQLDPLPGRPDHSFARVWSAPQAPSDAGGTGLEVGPNGEIAIRALVWDDTMTPLFGWLVGSIADGLEVLFLEGDPVPGHDPGATVEEVEFSNFSAQGLLIVRVIADVPGSGFEDVLYGRKPSGDLEIIVRDGDTLEIPPGLLRTFNWVEMTGWQDFQSSTGTGPAARALNDRGQVALLAGYGGPANEGIVTYDARWLLAAQPACSNALDDDGDGLFDYPDDPGCFSPDSAIEDPQCQDGLDNDGAFGTDFDGGESILGVGNGDPDGPDPQCVGDAWRNREAPKACGLGFELVFLLAPLAALRLRRNRVHRRG